MPQISNKSVPSDGCLGGTGEAQDETRTRDPFLTMEVLYQLSYLGGPCPILAGRTIKPRFSQKDTGPTGPVSFGDPEGFQRPCH